MFSTTHHKPLVLLPRNSFRSTTSQPCVRIRNTIWYSTWNIRITFELLSI